MDISDLEQNVTGLGHIPHDVLSGIIRFISFEITCIQIFGLLTVSKHFNNCLQTSTSSRLLLSELFEFLFSTEIGKQMVTAREKKNSWKGFLTAFREFSEGQEMQLQFLKSRSHLSQFSRSKNLTEFKLNDQLVFQKNGALLEKVFPRGSYFLSLFSFFFVFFLHLSIFFFSYFFLFSSFFF